MISKFLLWWSTRAPKVISNFIISSPLYRGNIYNILVINHASAYIISYPGRGFFSKIFARYAMKFADFSKENNTRLEIALKCADVTYEIH